MHDNGSKNNSNLPREDWELTKEEVMKLREDTMRNFNNEIGYKMLEANVKLEIISEYTNLDMVNVLMLQENLRRQPSLSSFTLFWNIGDLLNYKYCLKWQAFKDTNKGLPLHEIYEMFKKANEDSEGGNKV